jgi:hypothetical protein
VLRGELLRDDAQKSPPQIFIEAIAHLLDTLRHTNIGTIATTWEVNHVLAALSNQATVQHILASSEGGQALVRLRAELLSAAEHERRRLAGF